jgi:hypothetical protein
MRALALVLVAAAALFGAYELYLKNMPASDSGTAPTQAISLTGVRADLLEIAQAERGNLALTSHCVSLPELVSGGSLGMEKPGRDGYSYDITCSDGVEFQVTARHAPARADAAIRYPTLAIDSTMSIRELP